MSLAIIETGSKQYLVEPGKKIKVEKLVAEEGKVFVFDKVLLRENQGKVELGKPFIEKAKVEAKVLKQDKAKKVIIFKYKPKKRYKIKKGHRQPFTELEITKII
ncbi:50S ribosomal protein L21 [Candidatus Gribaldobacteria bacterium]|nr:50S ribosomal protein L21 [Candidatus Gribaldobacteria bacterium]